MCALFLVLIVLVLFTCFLKCPVLAVKCRYLAKSRSPVSNGKACLGIYNMYRNICGLHSSNLRTELSANFEIRGSFSSEFAFGSKELAE